MGIRKSRNGRNGREPRGQKVQDTPLHFSRKAEQEIEGRNHVSSNNDERSESQDEASGGVRLLRGGQISFQLTILFHETVVAARPVDTPPAIEWPMLVLVY